MSCFKVSFSQLESAIRAVENTAMRAKADQHFEEAAGLRTAASILRSVALEIQGPPIQRAPRPEIQDMPASAYTDPQP